MKLYPIINFVKPLDGKKLLVAFSNGVQKIYDCTPLLNDEVFEKLADDSLFQSVKADYGGYGISWNDEIDLSESELWMNGVVA